VADKVNWRNIGLGVLASVLVSASVGIGGTLLSAWNDLATLSVRVAHLEQDNA